jgi:O-antigen/teichoic acid export membrane protein
VIFTGLNLLLSPLFAVLEGGGLVAQINRLRTFQGISGNIVGWIIVFLGGGLFMAVATAAVPFIFGASWILIKKRQFFNFVFKSLSIGDSIKNGEVRTFDWKTELLPMQWKIALSWISGFFIFQLYNPILFYYRGPAVAGKMGMTMVITNALSQISIAWVYVKIPRFGAFIAQKNWLELDALFIRAFRLSMLVAIVGSIASVCCIWVLQKYTPWGIRFLNVTEVALVLGSIILNNYIAAIAVYLRAHKEDPFVWLSLIGAVLTSISVWLGAKYFSSLGVVSGTFLLNLFYGIPTTYYLWKKLRKKWHCEVI